MNLQEKTKQHNGFRDPFRKTTLENHLLSTDRFPTPNQKLPGRTGLWTNERASWSPCPCDLAVSFKSGRRLAMVGQNLRFLFVVFFCCLADFFKWLLTTQVSFFGMRRPSHGFVYFTGFSWCLALGTRQKSNLETISNGFQICF